MSVSCVREVVLSRGVGLGASSVLRGSCEKFSNGELGVFGNFMFGEFIVVAQSAYLREISLMR